MSQPTSGLPEDTCPGGSSPLRDRGRDPYRPPVVLWVRGRGRKEP